MDFRCSAGGLLARKAASLIDKKTYGTSNPIEFNLTPTSLELTETAESIFLSPQAAVNP